MKKLPPLVLKDEYFKDIEKEINRLFFEIIYKPILLSLKKKQYTNSSNILTDAIMSGRISFDGEYFTGSFNITLSKELKKIGAVQKKKGWKFEGALPPEISTAIGFQEWQYKAAVNGVLQRLDAINVDEINNISTIPDQYIDTIERMDEAFYATVKSITIPAKLTESQRNIIAAEWGQNLDLYVKSWTSENILKMREDIQTNVFAGKSTKSLEKYILGNFKVSKSKARFLARQETSLLLSKFRETRYKDIGSIGYIWRGSMDERERKDHKILEGKFFTWDNPPVVDRKTGRRAHAGEDFGCRCVGVPVIQ